MHNALTKSYVDRDIIDIIFYSFFCF